MANLVLHATNIARALRAESQMSRDRDRHCDYLCSKKIKTNTSGN